MANVVAVIDDLFFVAKVQAAARQAGVSLTSVRAADFALEGLRPQKPALVIVDLNTTSADAVELVRQLKADGELAAIPVIGFFSHVQVELQRAARAAGCDQVLPRSKFVTALPELIKHFAATGD